MATLQLYQQRALVIQGSEQELERARVLNPEELIDLGQNTVAYKWNYHNAALLALANLPAVSPIYRDYNWPAPNNFRPYQHQIVCADFLCLRKKAYCFAGTGTGKTAIGIWAAHYLYTLGLVKKILVLCRASILLDAWQPTAAKLLFGVADFTVIEGTIKKKQEQVASAAPFHITNYEALEGLHDKFIQNNYDLIILDESTKIKNRETDLWMLVYPLVRNATYAWQMTGTPTPMGPKDAFGQICMFEGFGNTVPNIYWWENLTTWKVNKFKRLPLNGWQNTVAKYMQPAIRIRTRDCLDLPPISYESRYLPLTSVQNAAIKMLRVQQMVNLAGENITGDNQAILLNKVVQICCGAVLSENGKVVEMKPTKRLNECLEIIHSEEGKVIIFAPFRAAVDMIARYLHRKNIAVGIIHGGISKTARQKIFDSFQNDVKEKMQVIVGVPSAFAHGVTLTEASHTIWFAPYSSTEVYLQANARMERNGQTRHMTVTEIWGDQREKQLYDIIAGRADAQLTLLDIYRSLLKDNQGD
ncbi:DEAD/DEAH box helicase [Xenorhabdus sp. XENO-10]|uniref:DEAD/DEAH box helicase n=1 Tax=Xenorhabdus yunnanensis TaxID=3025878 RepID=A0ABT5LJ37_9GAMM|nr:DEAD/DEAH box helicase [Xenorhabdus yunnanensis]MDC9589800.1 DEAD/DEAH box helicase [Xenorhabdus yunnanensis]